MQKILFLKGLPASGKTTFAKKLCVIDANFKRINKDDIREEMNVKWSLEVEKEVLIREKIQGISYLLNGYSVIVDDTNFSDKHKNYWMKISKFTQYGDLENELNNLENALKS